MMVDTTVYGWLLDGSVICSTCADLDRWSPGIGELLGEDGPRPLYSIDDTEARGLTCESLSGDCSGWVFEPACAECYAEWSTPNLEFTYRDYEDDWVCEKCADEDQDEDLRLEDRHDVGNGG